MQYRALAVDYDGTLAKDGVVDSATVQALRKLRATSRQLLMVTGRELPELSATFAFVSLFDRVVAENGALLYDPKTGAQKALADAPPAAFIEKLQARDVKPLSTGKVIVATRQPHETIVLQTVRELGLELELIFNKGAVMVLPSGVNKGTGLNAALQELGLLATAVVGVGDAENDHSFLRLCGLAVAVANALPAVKERADLVTRGARGDGVQELIARLIENDLGDIRPRGGLRAPVG